MKPEIKKLLERLHDLPYTGYGQCMGADSRHNAANIRYNNGAVRTLGARVDILERIVELIAKEGS